MLAKQSWRLMVESNPLVSEFMKARYYPKTDFMNASLGPNPSYLWRSLLQTQDVLKQGMKKKIGNGLSTMAWKVPWLSDLEDGFIETEAYEQLQHAKVQALLDESQKVWDVEIISDLFNERDKNLILQIPIPVREKEDSWYWALEDKGEFSVKSCYRKLRGNYDCVNRLLWRKIWNLKLPGKIINFLWRACVNVLPTTVALQSRRVIISTNCPWCHEAAEDAVHVLFQCSIAKEVWCSVGLYDVIRSVTNESVMTIIHGVSNVCTNEQFLMIGLICWSLWSRRNKWVWERVNMSVFGIKAMALNLLADWNRAQLTEGKHHSSTNGCSRTWVKPPEEWIKINIDASYHSGGNKIGVGCVIRDSRGLFLRARTNCRRGTTQVREAEAYSLWEAIEWVKNWRTTKCIFETDSTLLVDAFQRDRGRSNFDTIVEACSDSLKHFEEVLIVFASRSANRVAHSLAQVFNSMPGPMEWLSAAPDFISCNLDLDII
ncbi:uncharacterized protein LOC141659993 [Apium graveolens]|uniref:uncharacterized protein LOC141659993 n=1 Tax=Apium graveolens TaxID=4045 RepID=UPI003D79CF65